MKLNIFFLLIITFSAAADETHKLRRLDVTPPIDPPNLENVQSKVVAEVDLPKNAKAKFVAVGELKILVVLEVDKESEEALRGILDDEETDAITLFKQLSKNKPVPPDLQKAVDRVDEVSSLGKPGWPDPPEPEAATIPQHAEDDSRSRTTEDREDEKRKNGGDRSLQRCTPPDHRFGGYDWWRYNYCGKSGRIINSNECQCYYDLIGNNSPGDYTDNYFISWAHAFEGNLQMYYELYLCIGFWIFRQCAWVRTFEEDVNQGQVKGILSTPSGNVRARMGVERITSYIRYDWSIYTTDDSVTCSNSCGTHCSFCPNTSRP